MGLCHLETDQKDFTVLGHEKPEDGKDPTHSKAYRGCWGWDRGQSTETNVKCKTRTIHGSGGREWTSKNSVLWSEQNAENP